ncbi:MAG: alpha/beta hydrolase [Spongiibacter sp.]|nr:alpha/beta hydrolase [Spongiibacter sp.]
MKDSSENDSDSQFDSDHYDEFATLAEVAEEIGIFGDLPEVRRIGVAGPDHGHISAIKWGHSAAELVFLHGSGQNAHTWDALALALGRPALAIDLPGHGHSSWRDDRDYSPQTNAEALAPVIQQLAPQAKAVVGMSLGGATLIRLASCWPELIKRVILVDVTPGTRAAAQQMQKAGRGSMSLYDKVQCFPSFEAMAAAALAASPKRPAAATLRSVRQNARQRENGEWVWRYDRLDLSDPIDAARYASLWDDVGKITAPLMLVRGGRSRFVRDDDEVELRRRVPDVRVECVPEAGHSVQNFAPLRLAEFVRDFAGISVK